MIKPVLEISEAQKDSLIGVSYNGTGVFNPQLDAGDAPLDAEGFHVLDEDGENRKWFITKEEQAMCDHTLHPNIHGWIHDLQEIEHNPVKIK